MAPRVKQTADGPQETEKPGNAWAELLKPSEGLKKVSVTRDGKPNPLSGFAARSVGNPLALPVKNGAQAKDVTNWLRQDQLADESLKNGKLSIQYQDGNGNVLRPKKEVGADGRTRTTFPDEIRQVHFVVKPGVRVQRRYGKSDIVKWFKDTKGVDIVGAISKEQRAEFKRANGYDTVKKSA